MIMNKSSYLLDPVRALHGVNESVKEREAVLISDNRIICFGNTARKEGKQLGLSPYKASSLLIAPCLVDPHSILEDPIKGKSENLSSLLNAAANAGYGQLAILPRSSRWRDSPESLQGFSNPLSSDVLIHLWGGFSKGSNGKELAPHADLLQHGAIGIAEDDFMPCIELVKKGLVLGEICNAPFLLAPRDKKIQGNGFVREGVETLRAGWSPDPIASETLPLEQIIELQKQHSEASICIMNISTSEGISILKSNNIKVMSSVSWWHLVADRNNLSPCEIGWRVTPSLGGIKDRTSLINGLRENEITAVAVHAVPQEAEELQLPPDQRAPGICGHQLVLPSLWQELVVKEKFSIEKLWQALSFGPSKMLKLKQEKLQEGSRRWLLYDPDKIWEQNRNLKNFSLAANHPWQEEKIKGKVIACGLTDEGLQFGD